MALGSDGGAVAAASIGAAVLAGVRCCFPMFPVLHTMESVARHLIILTCCAWPMLLASSAFCLLGTAAAALALCLC